VQTSWKGQNVNLANLVQKIIQFFESNRFDNVTALKTETGYQVIAGDSNRYKMENDVSVTVNGMPDDFSVSLTSCKQEKKFALPLILTSMFGGGFFVLKDLKSDEAMQKLERDFRAKIGNMIEQSRELNSQEKTAN